MPRYIRYTSLLLITLSLTSCTHNSLTENKIYKAKDVDSGGNISKIVSKVDTDGKDFFVDFEKVSDSAKSIPIAISNDKKQIFFMEPEIVTSKAEGYRVLKGEVNRKVSIVRYDAVTQKRTVLLPRIPFISTVKWNTDGSIVAFNGGGELTVYDLKEDKLLIKDQMDNELNGGLVNYFGWSWDGKKIYTEHPIITNGTIYYIDSKSGAESFETREKLYFKGILDDNYFYATRSGGITNALSGDDTTVVVDKNGTIIRELGAGRFRDSYKREVLLTGQKLFGLRFIPDVNNNKSVQLSKEYIYDAKFVQGGNIAFITSDGDEVKNDFLLHIANKEGKEIYTMQVSGSRLVLLPDGKSGYISGELCEKINFTENMIQSLLNMSIREEEERIFETLRGAMDVCYKYEIKGEKDYEGVKKYFINDESINQYARFDMETKFNDMASFGNQENYMISMYLKSYTLNANKDRAEVYIGVAADNYLGSAFNLTNELEMVKVDERWYISGFSTFSNSSVTKEVRQKAEECVKLAAAGSLFEGTLKGKDIKISQLQFWQAGSPHLAENIENANYCKVYLKVKENGTEIIYKMILEKKGQNNWKASQLGKEKLSNLF